VATRRKKGAPSLRRREGYLWRSSREDFNGSGPNAGEKPGDVALGDRKGLVLAACSMGAGLIGFTNALIGPSLKFMAAEFGLSLWETGMLASAVSFGYMFSFFGGLLSDRIGELNSILMALASLAILCLSVSSSGGFQACFTSLAFLGLSIGTINSTTTFLVARTYTSSRGWALNVLHAFFGVGALSGPTAAGWLLSSGSSWRAVYSTPVLLSIPAGLLALAASARAKGGGASSSKLDLRALLVAKDPIFLLLALATFSHMGMAIGSTAWLPTYLMLHGGFDPKLAGLTIGLFWGCVGLGRLVLAKVPEGVGLERSLTIFAISAGFLSWAGISAKDPYATMALWALSGLAFSTTLPSVLALLVREVPGATGSAMGLLFSIGMVGSIFSQWAIGFLGGLTSLSLSIHCVSLFAFAMGLIPLAMPLALGSKGKALG